MDGALHVYKRENSRFWQCATYLGSRNYRQTTKEESLAAAKDFARDWYMERCVEDRQRRRGGVAMSGVSVQTEIELPGPPVDGRRRRAASGPSFADAAKAFTEEFEVITLGERNADYVESKSEIIRLHLNPFFGDTPVQDITAGKVQEYRVHRQTSRIDPKTGKPKKPARAAAAPGLRWSVRIGRVRAAWCSPCRNESPRACQISLIVGKRKTKSVKGCSA